LRMDLRYRKEGGFCNEKKGELRGLRARGGEKGEVEELCRVLGWPNRKKGKEKKEV